MTKLADKVQHAVQEARILVVGTTVLIGFDYRGVFEKGFEQLPKLSQQLKLLDLGLLLLALALLLWPSAYHNLVDGGEDTRRFHAFATGVMDWALLPLALGISLNLCLAFDRVYGHGVGALAGVVAALVALYFWYGLEYQSRSKTRSDPMEARRQAEGERKEEAQGTPVSKKMDHVLEEVRSVLPGVQALLGFQLAAMLVQGFGALPPSSKHLHLLSLGLNALAIVLLMAPAAYHRIVCEGEDTEQVHRFASRMILAAMVPLALGLAGDLFVVVRKITDSISFATGAALCVLVVFYGCWFGYTGAQRAAQQAAGGSTWRRAGQPARPNAA